MNFHFCVFTLLVADLMRVYSKDQKCSEQLNNCTTMVKPYLNDIKYMFPTTIEDVDVMCKMWSQFVDCVRRYVTSCFSEERRLQFHKSVETSVDTVHAICSSEMYQQEYLAKAACFKQVSVDSCGDFYRQLIEHVANPRAHDDHICCSYGQFKDCVNDPLLRECGRRARNLMDHSMGFLISRCEENIKTSFGEKCPTPIKTTSPAPPTTNKEEMMLENINPEEVEVSNSLPMTMASSAREDRSHSSQIFTTWAPRTLYYTMPPEPGSRTSAAFLFKVSFINFIFFIFFINYIFHQLCI